VYTQQHAHHNKYDNSPTHLGIQFPFNGHIQFLQRVVVCTHERRLAIQDLGTTGIGEFDQANVVSEGQCLED
jgi:hypothetical protein